MDDVMGVLDAPEVDVEPIETEPVDPAEPIAPAEPIDNDSGAYTTKESREMRAALRQWKAEHPEFAKFANRLRDNHERLFTLNQLEPKGIDGVREKYALLDSLVMGDQKGPEALTAMQERHAAVQETDSYLASGDPRALEAFGEEFNDGLAKLAPAYLERVMKANPEAYAAAVLPHFVSSLGESEWYQNQVALMNIKNEKPPAWLPEDKLAAWHDDRNNRISALIDNNVKWWNAQVQKAGSAPPPTQGQAPAANDRTAFDKERQDFHWNSKITPGVTAHENKTFEDLFAPYQRRLKLDDKAVSKLKGDFKAELTALGRSDKDYMRQMGLFQKQGTPDPATVQNYVKNAISKHGKTALDGIVTARYGRFLTAPAKPAVQSNGVKPIPPAEASVEVRSVMPPRDQIDFQRTPPNWMASTYPGGKKYYLNNGKVIQIRPTA